MDWFTSGMAAVAVINEAEGFIGVRDAGWARHRHSSSAAAASRPCSGVRNPEGEVLNFVGCAPTSAARLSAPRQGRVASLIRPAFPWFPMEAPAESLCAPVVPMNLIQTLEKEEIARITKGKTVPSFDPGDTLRVNVKIKEGDRERVQAYEGICIARSGAGLNANFTVRKISFGEGVERVFPLYSPTVDSIEVVRRGEVRRAKLYYLRDRRGKSARIAERGGGAREDDFVGEAADAGSEAAK